MSEIGRQHGLNGTHHHILPAFVAAAAFVEHAETFADARGVTEKDLQPRSGLILFVRLQLLQELLRSRLFFDCCTHSLIIACALGVHGLRPFRKALIEGHVHGEHVDAGFAEEAKIAIFGLRGDDGLDVAHLRAASLGDARGLGLGVGNGNVRIKTAGGGGDGVGRNGTGIGGVFLAVLIGGSFHAVDKLLAGGAEVGAGGGSGVVTIVTGGGRAWMKVLGLAEILAEQF